MYYLIGFPKKALSDNKKKTTEANNKSQYCQFTFPEIVLRANIVKDVPNKVAPSIILLSIKFYYKRIYKFF